MLVLTSPDPDMNVMTSDLITETMSLQRALFKRKCEIEKWLQIQERLAEKCKERETELEALRAQTLESSLSK